MKVTMIFVNWDEHFITTDYMEAVKAYLKFGQMTMAEYAVEEGIIDWLGPDEEMRDEEKDECINSILDNINYSMGGWDYIELPIEY